MTHGEMLGKDLDPSKCSVNVHTGCWYSRQFQDHDSFPRKCTVSKQGGYKLKPGHCSLACMLLCSFVHIGMSECSFLLRFASAFGIRQTKLQTLVTNSEVQFGGPMPQFPRLQNREELEMPTMEDCY